ncbi:hypothetical protein ACFVZH_36950, partial [Streptomyces sp. NPDC059534]|uniref:hypothetical protein n=1 Tax=Streptomyces sp. NPDC059534 TaxID=3346859 RepID=UPI00368510CD
MASASTTRRRLGAAVATVLAVTVGAGVLSSPGAVAAPAAVTAGTAATAEANLPLDAEIVSSGDTGYLTSRKDDGGNTVLEWHRTDGSVMPVNTGTMGHDSNSDIAVTSNGGSMVFLRDMTPGATWSAYFDIMAQLGSGAKLVGVVGRNLFVSVPTTGDYRELWQLSQTDGVAKKTKLSSRTTSVDYKVVASAGNDLIVLGSTRVFSGPTFRTEYWKALTNVNNGSVVDWGGTEAIGPWTQASTGAYTADHKAWVEYTAGVTELVVAGPGARKDIAMDSSMSGAVIAGIVGDVLLYGVPGTAAGETPSPLYARNLKDPAAVPYKLLDNFSSVAHSPDGALLVRGFSAEGDGLFRVSGGVGGARPAVALVADTGRVMAVKVTESQVPATLDLEKPGTQAPLAWTLSRANATVDVTLTHSATGRKVTQRLPRPLTGSRFTFAWDGLLDGVSAPNGRYTWQLTATPDDGLGGPATASGGFQVVRQANPHDYNDNGSTDLLARDAAGVLWRDDLRDWPVGGQIAPAKRTRLGAGWQVYNQIEAAGNLAGAPAGDL